MMELTSYFTCGKTGAGRLACMLLSGALLLTSCVTTTTGGFNPDASEEQAVQDYIQLALAYYDANDMAGARRHINNALTINDQNSEVYNVLSLIYQREGDMDLAEQSFRRAISLDPGNSRARNNYAAFLYGVERFQEAFEQLQVVAGDTNYEGRAIAFENLGRNALRTGNSTEAEQAFERALQLNDNLYMSALELAQIRVDNGDLDGARQAFGQYLTLREFNGIPYTPRSLWIGIQIERQFQNNDVVDGYVRLLTGLYQDSPEFQLYRNLVNDN